MSLRDTLQAEVDRLEKAHQVNADAYYAVRDAAQEAQAKSRPLKDVAAISANELAAARGALAAFDKQSGRTVKGAGNVKAGSAK